MDLYRTSGRAIGLWVWPVAAAWLAFAASAFGFSFSSLNLGATNGPENYVFTAGDNVTPVAQIDANRIYRIKVLNPAGVAIFASACGTNFAAQNNSYVIRDIDAPSTNGPYVFRIEQFTSCSSTQTIGKIDKPFYVVRAEAFNGSTPTDRFAPGETASLRIFGLPPNQANWSTTWLAPDGSISCNNTNNSDRPDSSSNGTLPATSGAYLIYPPWPGATDAWNDSNFYEGPTCSGLTTNDLGFWKLKLQKSGTNVVTLPAFNVARSCAISTLTNLTRSVMASASFVATSFDDPAFSYRWFRNGALLAGETNNTLTLTNLTLSDAGTYTVEVNGPCGIDTQSATLTVFSCAPNLDVMLVIDRSGSMLGQAYTDARTACTNLIRDLHLGLGDQAGLVSYNTTATVHQTLTNDAAAIEQAVSDLPVAERGTAISAGLQAARDELLSNRHDPFALPVIVLMSDGLPHAAGDSSSNVLFNAKLAKSAGMLVFTVAIGEADPSLMSAVASASNTFFLATNSAQFTELFHAIASLVCRAPTNFVVSGLSNQTLCAGAPAAFGVTATGCNVLGYEWSRDGVLVPGATNSTFVIPNALPGDSGEYSVAVHGDCYTVVTSATLSVTAPPSNGEIAPVNTCVGNYVVLQTTPDGTPPFSFVWRKQGDLLVGQTNASLAISNATVGDSGDYSVDIYNSCGARTNTVQVSVQSPVGATPMDDQTQCVGGYAVFTTTLDGVPGSIVWRKDGVLIANENNRWLILPITSSAAAGRYSVEVSSSCNSVTNTAALNVFEPVQATPLADSTNFIGETATFSTIVSGSGPFTFIWRKDGVQITGATMNSLIVLVSSLSDAGDYSVEVIGACSSEIRRARLTVQGTTTATPLVDATNCIGETVVFSTTAGGTGPFSFAWRKDGAAIPAAASNALNVVITSLEDAGEYAVEVTGAASSVTNRARLTVNEATKFTPIGRLNACVGTSLTLTNAHVGTGPFTYMWRKEGVPIPGATNRSLFISAATEADAGDYAVEITGCCNSVTNDATVIINTSPQISGLVDAIACPGETVALSASVTGTGPLTYAWRHNGNVISGATGSTLVLTNMNAAGAGNYSFEASGPCDTATRTLAVSVRTNLSATPLTNIARCVGGTAVFATTVSGPAPYTMQWKKDGVLLIGQTSTTLSLNNLTVSDSGNYSIEIIGGCNAITNTATLTVNSTTTATPLSSVSACEGFPVAFSTTPAGVPPFTFVWRRNGVVLTNQTNNTLTIASVTVSNAGTYSVAVSGACGSVTNTATLSVANGLSATMPATLALCGCEDGVLAPLVTGATPVSFRWYHDGVLMPETSSFLLFPKANRATPGTYRVEISSGCNTVTNTTIVTIGNVGTSYFHSPQSITIPDFGAVSPYPSILTVNCAPVSVSELRVTLHGLGHDYPDDLDIMLVSPAGQALMLMSDAGGTSINYIDNVTLTFSDNAEFFLPDTKKITNGIYKPTNYGAAGDDIFEIPAPAGPNITNISGFYGSNPNGNWRLFVVDDHGLDRGVISGGWSLDFGNTFTTDAQLHLSATTFTNGVFNALLYGSPGSTCFVEGSTNMRDWTVISTNQLTVSPQPVATTNLSFPDYRFFRASSCRNN